MGFYFYTDQSKKLGEVIRDKVENYLSNELDKTKDSIIHQLKDMNILYSNSSEKRTVLPDHLFKERVTTTLPKGLLVPIPLVYEQIYGDLSDLTGIRVGGKYFLREESCEGFEMPMSVYECKHIIKEFGGMQLNSAVMKQLEGNEDMIFSLTRTDCKNIGIAYEPRLQLFPLGFNWKRAANDYENVPFDAKNMATYKPSPKDDKIHQMHVIMKNISATDTTGYIKTPANGFIDFNVFASTLTFKFRDFNLYRKYPISYKFLSDNKNTLAYNSRTKTLEVMLFFGIDGIDPKEFENKGIDDIIEVSWVEEVLVRERVKQPQVPLSDERFNNNFRQCFKNNNFLDFHDPFFGSW